MAEVRENRRSVEPRTHLPVKHQPKSGWGAEAPSSSSGSEFSTQLEGVGSDGSAPAVPARPSRRQAQASAEFGSGNLSSQPKFNDDVITDIAELPEVEQSTTSGGVAAAAPVVTSAVDDNTQQTEAPNVRTNRMQALQELDQEIGYSSTTSQLDGIDLSLLTSQLLPQDACVEPDVVWEFDQLFTEVSSLDEVDAEQDEPEPVAISAN